MARIFRKPPDSGPGALRERWRTPFIETCIREIRVIRGQFLQTAELLQDLEFVWYLQFVIWSFASTPSFIPTRSTIKHGSQFTTFRIGCPRIARRQVSAALLRMSSNPCSE